VTALANTIYVDGVQYVGGTDHTAMPANVVDQIRNPAAWVGGTAPALSVVPDGKARLSSGDLTSATKVRAALGIEVSLLGGHIVPTGATPTVVAQAGAGTSATVTVSGRDTAGVVALTAGSASLAAGAQVVLTFAKPFAAPPAVVVSGGPNAAVLHPYATATTTTMTLSLVSAPSASTVYSFHYVVIGR
jgi:hypothetical protein